MTITEKRSSAFLSAALADLDAIQVELGEQSRDYCVAEVLRRGLACGAGYLDDLGAFIDVPVSSNVTALSGTVRLFPIDLSHGLRNPQPRVQGNRLYATPKGDLVGARSVGGKLLWNQKRWLVSDTEICAVGRLALEQMRAAVITAIGTTEREEASA